MFVLEVSGVAVQRIHQNSETWWLLWGMAEWNDFEAILATFCCYEYSANASEEVQKITTDQKGYSKCSSCVIVYWIAKTCQSVTVKKGWLLGHLRGS